MSMNDPYGAAQGGPASPAPSRTLRVPDALVWSWERIKDNPIALIAGTAVWSLLGRGPITVTTYVNGGFETASTSGSYAVASIVSLFSSIALAHVGLSVAGGRKVGLIDFMRFPNIVQMLLAGLIIGVVASLGLAACILPGLVVLYGWHFTQLIGVERGTSALAAMRQSWEILTDNLDRLFFFALAGVLLTLVGTLTVVGWIITGPLEMLLTAYAYVLITGRQVVG